MNLNPNKSISFVPQSFTRKKSENIYRVALLGESSVYNLFPYHQKIAERIQKRINGKQIELINLGGNSYGSTRLLIVAHEIINYDLDEVFIYLGNNEFEEVVQYSLVSSSSQAFNQYFYRSAIARVMRDFYLKIQRDKLREKNQQRLLEKAPDTFSSRYYHFTVDEKNKRMDLFASNLEKMILLFNHKNVKVNISTIPSNQLNPLIHESIYHRFLIFKKMIDKKDYVEAKKLIRTILVDSVERRQSSDLENNIIRSLASKYHLKFVDFEQIATSKEPNQLLGETLFKDHCHLNHKGNELLIQSFFN